MKRIAILTIFVAIFLFLMPTGWRAFGGQSAEKLEYQELWRLDKDATLGSVSKISLHPDGKYIAAAYQDDAYIYLIDASDGKTVEKFASSRFKGAKITINDLTWSNTGKFIASALLFETVEVWSFSDSKLTPLFSIVLDDSPYFVSWSADDKYIAIISETGGGPEGSIWDAQTGKKVITLSGQVAQIEWQSNSEQFATIDEDGKVELWSIRDNTPTKFASTNSPQFSTPIAWSPDNKLLAINTSEPQTNKCSVEIFDTSTVKIIATLEDRGTLYKLSWRSDGQLIAGGGYKRLRIWGVKSAQVLASFENYSDLVNTVSWNKQGNLLAIGNNDGSIQLLKISYQP